MQSIGLPVGMQAGDVWALTYDLTTTSSGVGVLYQLSAPPGATVEGWVESQDPPTGATVLQRISAINTPTSVPGHVSVGLITGTDRIWLTVTNGPTGGNASLQIANATALGTFTVAKGSRVEATPATGV